MWIVYKNNNLHSSKLLLLISMYKYLKNIFLNYLPTIFFFLFIITIISIKKKHSVRQPATVGLRILLNCLLSPKAEMLLSTELRRYLFYFYGFDWNHFVLTPNSNLLRFPCQTYIILLGAQQSLTMVTLRR